mgnify:CR=1 FL=1
MSDATAVDAEDRDRKIGIAANGDNSIPGGDDEVEVDLGRLRAADIPYLVGDHSKFSDATDWQTEIPLEKTLSDL